MAVPVDRPVDPTEVGRMLAAMPTPSPDEVGVWSGGGAGLGQTDLHVTPESLTERFPVAAGGLVVVGDIRLDNRDELLDLLDGDLRDLGLQDGGVGDGALVLSAFRRWGRAAVDRFVGAFAFVVWDEADRRLVAARDPIGIRPLFYHAGPGGIAVASEPYGVLAAEGVPRRIDEAQVAEALTQRLVSPTRTSFVGVDKLEAGHLLTWERGHLHTTRYWTPRARPPSGRDHAEEFADLFERAVRDRMRSAFPVGVELSGGLDSTAVAVTAAPLAPDGQGPLRAFSSRFDRSDRVDESVYIDAVLSSCRALEPHAMFPDQERFVSLYGEIFDRAGVYRLGGNVHLNYLSVRAAASTGTRVLLTGQDGDSVVGHGWELFAERAVGGEWRGLREEAAAITGRLSDELDRYDGQFVIRTPNDVANMFLGPLLRESVEDNRLRQAWNVGRTLQRAFGGSPKLMARRMWRSLVVPPEVHRRRRRRAALEQARVPSVVPPHVAEATDLRARLADSDHALEEAKRGVYGAADVMAQAFTIPHMAANFEKLDAFSAAFGIEARHPFMDTRLIEFSLGLPVGERLREGYTRSILRRALGDRLPPEVARRANKAHLGAAYDRFVLESEPDRLADVLRSPGLAEAFVDVGAARGLLGRAESLTPDEILWLANAVTTVLWANGARVRGALGVGEAGTTVRGGPSSVVH